MSVCAHLCVHVYTRMCVYLGLPKNMREMDKLFLKNSD